MLCARVLTPVGQFQVAPHGGCIPLNNRFCNRYNRGVGESPTQNRHFIITNRGILYPGLFKFSRIVTNSIFLSSDRCKTGPGGLEQTAAALRLPETRLCYELTAGEPLLPFFVSGPL